MLIDDRLRLTLPAYFGKNSTLILALKEELKQELKQEGLPTWYGKDVKKKEMTIDEVKELENMLSDFI